MPGETLVYLILRLANLFPAAWNPLMFGCSILKSKLIVLVFILKKRGKCLGTKKIKLYGVCVHGHVHVCGMHTYTEV